MTVYKPSSIEKEPDVILRNWKIYDIGKTIHFLGFNVLSGDGRVSSPILKFDSKSMTGITRSGRVYYLDGESGSNSDAEYVWSIWCKYNNVDSQQVKIITDFDEIQLSS